MFQQICDYADDNESYIEPDKNENLVSLQDIYQKDLKLDNVEIMKIMYGLIKAIEELHLKIRVHKNLDPKNILFDQNLHVRLSNIGKSDENSKYLAPESQCNGIYNLKSDVYSYGAIINELLDKYNVLNEGKLPVSIIERFMDMIEECLLSDLNKRLISDEVVEFFEEGNTIIDENLDYSKYILESNIKCFEIDTICVEKLKEYIKQGKYFIAYHWSVVGSMITNDLNYKFGTTIKS